MSKSTYKPWFERLKDPRWQKKRLEILERDGWACKSCWVDQEKMLHVHHKVYRRGLEPWEYESTDLVTYCEDCHDEVAEVVRELVLTAHSYCDAIHWLKNVTTLTSAISQAQSGNYEELTACLAWSIGDDERLAFIGRLVEHFGYVDEAKSARAKGATL